MAKHETAGVDIPVLEKTADGKLRAIVLVTNKTGHYLPSGVGFRRVFLEFLVRDAAGTFSGPQVVPTPWEPFSMVSPTKCWRASSR
jgi:hypothetical protein